MMRTSNPIQAAALSLLLIFSIELTSCKGNNGGVLCPEIEKQSLLNFQNSLEDPDGRFASWNPRIDCCKWKGVVCDNMTGRVHQLRLGGGSYSRPSGIVDGEGLSGKINPSLLNLKRLKYLDLSRNNFTGETVPSFIGSLKSLEYLNLSKSGFAGRIPRSIGNLSKLQTLDLEGDLGENSMDVENLEWLSGLSQLEYLNMNNANLSRATNWWRVINTLRSLQQLHFQSCHLGAIAPLISHVNVTSLTHVDLSLNSFPNAVPDWIFQLPNLVYLDLRYNSFTGSIPSSSKITRLRYIDLSYNSFNSSIPDWLYLCKELEFLSLGSNALHGVFPSAIANMTSLTTLDLSENLFSGKVSAEITKLCRLKKLDLSYNKFQGEISNSFGDMSECFLHSLEFISLRSNNLSGVIPEQFGEFKNLQSLDLRNNSLSGAIPASIGMLSSLELLYIDDNMLTGVVTEQHFANLAKLQTLSASRNQLTLKVSSDWDPPFQLGTLEIASWDLGGGSRIPSWIEKQRNVMQLDLSNTKITSDHVPIWFWKIYFLDLSHNNLSGIIPDGVESSYLYLSSNRFSGSLPRIAQGTWELDLSNNSFSGGLSHFLCDETSESYLLRIVDLGENRLTGVLPDCWTKWPYLEYLHISNNNISGSIPNSIGLLGELQSINLDGNRISGQIPSSIHNCTYLIMINLAHNNLDGNIPIGMGTSLSSLKVLILRSNKLSGEISPEVCRLSVLQVLDLSDNHFSGVIPKCVRNLTAMATKRSLEKDSYGKDSRTLSGFSFVSFKGDLIESASVYTKGTKMEYDTILSLVTVIDLSNNNLSGEIPKELTALVALKFLNLSENHFTGLIQESIGDMKELESLDLSRNSLSGRIPNSFVHLSSLSYLNLSYNNLSGRVPESTQLQSFGDSSFIGNDLCGPPLPGDCGRDGLREEEEDGNESEIEWFYVLLSLGYAVGVSVVCITMVFKESWREGYFEFLDRTWDKVYVYVRTK